MAQVANIDNLVLERLRHILILIYLGLGHIRETVPGAEKQGCYHSPRWNGVPHGGLQDWRKAQGWTK